MFKKQINGLMLIFCIFIQGCTSLEFGKHHAPFHPSPPQLGHTKIALVLGGGGSRGLAHVGVMEVLIAEGIYPDLIVGCSAGAIVGALYADNPDIPRIKRLLLNKRRTHLLDLSLENLPYGVSNGGHLRHFLSDHLEAVSFEELKIPFVAVATNLEYGDLVTFGSGPLLPALRASAAYPGVFLPVKLGGQYFVDGAVANPVPAEIARKLGAQFVIAVDLSGSLPDTLPGHAFGVLKRSMEISYIHLSRIAGQEADFLIKIPFKNVGTFEDNQNMYIYQLGRKVAQRAISDLKQQLALIKN